MRYALVVISVVSFVISTVSQKLFQQKLQKRDVSIFLFFTVSCFLASLFSFVLSGCTIPSSQALVFGFFCGLASFIVMFGSYKAFAKGSASLAAIIINMSLSIPIIYSFFVYDEKISLIQYIGLVLMIVSIVLSGCSDKTDGNGKKQSRMWLVFAVVAMLANGIVSIIQKEYQLVTAASDANSIVTISYITASALNLVVFLYNHRSKSLSSGDYFSSKLSFCAVCIVYSLSAMIGQITLLAVNTKIPAIILFPCLNGGIALLSAIAFLSMFKEKINFLKIISLILGLVAIVLLAI